MGKLLNIFIQMHVPDSYVENGHWSVYGNRLMLCVGMQVMCCVCGGPRSADHQSSQPKLQGIVFDCFKSNSNT